jgi:hypothetical protein
MVSGEAFETRAISRAAHDAMVRRDVEKQLSKPFAMARRNVADSLEAYREGDALPTLNAYGVDEIFDPGFWPPEPQARPCPRNAQPVIRFSISAKIAYMPTPMTATVIRPAKTSGTRKLDEAWSMR